MSKAWLTLNTRYPLPERRSRPRVSDNTVPHEGQIWRELGYVQNLETDEWRYDPGSARGESLNFSAGNPASHE